MLDSVDALIADKLKPHSPGLALAIAKNGEIIHRKGYGLANLEWDIPITPDTVFRLASITKQFTAVAIMLLQAQGKINLDDSLTRFLPDYPTSGHEVTIRQLLNHTSGIKSYTDLPGFFEKISTTAITPPALVEHFRNLPFDFKPGAQWQYNNSAYHLLGLIIEKLSGVSYGEFIKQHIFEPLGMQHSYYLDNEPIIPRRASGYVETPDGFLNAPFLNMQIPYAAGSLGSTVDDLLIWNQALFEGRLISADALATMHQPTILNDGTPYPYGLGWSVIEYRGHRGVQHSGGINGFNTQLMHLPADGLTIALLCNWNGFNTEQTLFAIARRALGIPEVTPTFVTLSAEQLDQFAGTYIDNRVGKCEIKRADDQLELAVGNFKFTWRATGATSFIEDNDPDYPIEFSDFRDGHYHHYTLKGITFTRTGQRAEELAT
ncbi:MAG: beta-lactamase family protein [Anaerolineae bacterium]|nr:beta-lactamase family protein [Anaerolineae bacterium]